MTVVLDAGAFVEIAVARGFEGPALDELVRSGGSVRAPELLDLEVMSVVRKLLQRGEITSRTAEVAVARLRDSPIVRSGNRGLIARTWALRDRMSPYDAAYVAVAEAGDPAGGAATLVTTDARLARTVRTVGTVPVVVVPVP